MENLEVIALMGGFVHHGISRGGINKRNARRMEESLYLV